MRHNILTNPTSRSRTRSAIKERNWTSTRTFIINPILKPTRCNKSKILSVRRKTSRHIHNLNNATKHRRHTLRTHQRTKSRPFNMTTSNNKQVLRSSTQPIQEAPLNSTTICAPHKFQVTRRKIQRPIVSRRQHSPPVATKTSDLHQAAKAKKKIIKQSTGHHPHAQPEPPASGYRYRNDEYYNYHPH